ncbi:Vitamin B12 import system permease protein BtuC [Porphyromonas macacae]|uniref:Vitamin B12 import system permease protein BtuC n=1 Tax=Porphyromonas macacae TaxID=28115 RepID=A0A379EAE4_9PORP|nr:iron ABC transporter permease [Porphyromonas macacae]SUB89645.1 Vitamin B12 import system permease protein BtuC [Porphyromonas macacae]
MTVMKNRQQMTWMGLMILFCVVSFIADILMAGIPIPLSDFGALVSGRPLSDSSFHFILMQLRLPKAITAVLAGAGVAVTGLAMQTLFRNPLADTSILGIGSGAGLGVAIFLMSSSLFPALSLVPSFSYTGMILSAIVGALAVLFVISLVALRIQDMVSVLIVGVMVGFIASSMVSILQYFSDPEIIQNYLIWTFGSLSGVGWAQLQWLIPICAIGFTLMLLMPKYLNALLLGNAYARSIGIRTRHVSLAVILVTSIIIGATTAFTGPISFVGIAIPHAARILLRTSDHRILIPATLLLGSSLMLVCDIISYLPSNGMVLPVNSITAVLGAPVVIAIILKQRSHKGKIFG